MTPVSSAHAELAGRLIALLLQHLGGHALPEVGVQTAENIFAPDVGWCSVGFWNEHKDETPLRRAPEICIEIASPSNAKQDLERKAHAYLAVGAVEAWIVYPRSKRIDFHSESGLGSHTAFAIELAHLFD